MRTTSSQVTLLAENRGEENEQIVITAGLGVHGLAATRIAMTRDFALKLSICLRDVLKDGSSFFHDDNCINPPEPVTFDIVQGLFVIPANGGYSCLGLEVCRQRAIKLAAELNTDVPACTPMELYHFYQTLLKKAADRNSQTGWRSKSELTPELIGYEGRRVEVIHEYKDGVRVADRFYVGKSMGFIPCHLSLKRRNSSDGEAVCLGRIISVTPL